MRVTMSAGGKVTIPKEILEASGLQPGDKLVILQKDNDIVVRPVQGKQETQEITEISPQSSHKSPANPRQNNSG